LKNFENMLLSDRDILEEMKNGNIIIEPFDPTRLQPNGYDISVGPVYYCLRRDMDVLFPFDRELVEKVFVRNVAETRTVEVGGRKFRGRFIEIPPYGFVLASTAERVGTKNGVVASIRTRSSLARCGICIVRGAGWGDVGFDGIWTVEIVSAIDKTFYLPVGMRIGQMVFFKTKSPPQNPYQGKYSGFSEPVLPSLYRDGDLNRLVEEIK
jgi:dCTP deaminase